MPEQKWSNERYRWAVFRYWLVGILGLTAGAANGMTGFVCTIALGCLVAVLPVREAYHA